MSTRTTTVQNSQRSLDGRKAKMSPITKTNIPESNSSSVSLPENAIQQLTQISLMLQYDIDNTLNIIKENGVQHQQQYLQQKQNQQLTQVNESQVAKVQQMDTEYLAHGEGNELNTNLPPTPPATPNLEKTAARKRWKILAKALRKDSEETMSSSIEDIGDEQTASVRRFKSFDLLRQDSFEDHTSLSCLGKPENWYKYRVILDTEGKQEYTLNIHHLERHWTANDLMGFNNTGNICVWPSEEALTAYVLSNLEAYNDKWILELGGGFTCLTGLMLAKYARPYAMHLTDGNEVSVENVKKTVCLNELSCYTKCSVLKWEVAASRIPAEEGKFDTILSADCLFFDEARSALISTIWFYLSSKGVALIMAPKRGKTMESFIHECTAVGFDVKIIERYNETIWERHLELKNSELYDEDLHYPILLILSKCSDLSSASMPTPLQSGPVTPCNQL